MKGLFITNLKMEKLRTITIFIAQVVVRSVINSNIYIFTLNVFLVLL